MNNVQFARLVGALAFLAGTGGLAAAQELPAADPSAIEQEQPVRSDPLEALPEDAVQTYDYPSPESDAALVDMADTFGIDSLAPGKFRWAASMPSEGAVKVVISLSDQLAFVYRGDELVGVSTISSGAAGHETPTGVFPILAKEKVHRSRKYDDAPMPYMQRLNQWGVAMHGGHLPGYPASHGCVRLPMAFAAKLFALTTRESKVIIEA